MSTRLVILGVLRQRPLHGYEIKQIIEEHMGDWTSIAFGSIYFALDRLATEGMIEKVATEQEGRRPSRNVYEITAAGREEFLRLLRQTWADVEHPYFAIDIAVAFLAALPRDEVVVLLRGRVARLKAILRYLALHEAEQMGRAEVPAAAAYIFAHPPRSFRS